MTKKSIVEIDINNRKLLKAERYHTGFEVTIGYGLGLFTVDMLRWVEGEELPVYYFTTPFCSGMEGMIEEMIKNIRNSNESLSLQDEAINSFASALMYFRIKHHHKH